MAGSFQATVQRRWCTRDGRVNRSTVLDVEMFELTRQALEPELGERWSHVRRARLQALSLCALDGVDGDLLSAAAIAHDIGYGPELVETGFHPIDGARYLRRQGVDERIVSLVA